MHQTQIAKDKKTQSPPSPAADKGPESTELLARYGADELDHGFDSFRWVFPPIEDFQPWHAHNELIQQLFAYGLVGLVIVVGVYLAFYREVRVSRDMGLKSLAMAMLILVLVRGLVDTDRFELCFPLWLMTMLSIALTRTSVSQY